jgi:hypothetical protein
VTNFFASKKFCPKIERRCLRRKLRVLQAERICLFGLYRLFAKHQWFKRGSLSSFTFFNVLMSDVREALWKNDNDLKESMVKYVGQNLQRREILDFLTRDFPQYAWSLGSLDRRLRHFNLYFKDNSVTVDEVIQAVETDLKGPGRLLGYRAMHKKIRQEHGLNVTRDQIYDVLYELCPEGLEERDGVGGKKQRKKGNFATKGTNWVHSLDGHDKVMGY